MAGEKEKLSADELLQVLREREEETKKATQNVAKNAAPGIAKTKATPVALVAGTPTHELVAELLGKQKAIYGLDGRLDHYAIHDAVVLQRAESVAAFFKAAGLKDNGNGQTQLRGPTFQNAYGLCDSEPYLDQPCGAFGSGFLVGPDLIATAGHCLDSADAADATDIRVVFGYRMKTSVEVQNLIPTGDVYSIKEVVGRKLQGKEDWAIVRLDRAVTGRPPLQIRRAGKVAKDAAVYVIGHPCGLPVKYAPGATVRSVSESTHFIANLDTFGGNSGSPVFGVDHVVQGILVRGETDFVSKGGCNVSMVFPTTGGNGEDCTYTSEFWHLVPAI
jgi:hypothetical protein